MGIKRWYGLIGLLSLLGFVGVFTGERYFLGFFAFAVDFQYFFTRADEMPWRKPGYCWSTWRWIPSISPATTPPTICL